MKLNKLIIALGLSVASIGVATAADPLAKSIDLKATINDSIFVSKPDGSTWYDTVEELAPNNYTQTEFSKTLQVRVYSSLNGFQVSLAQPLTLVNGGLSMTGVAKLGGKTLSTTAEKIKMTVASAAGGTAHDETYDLEIKATPPAATPGGASRNGAYTGKLAMVFEATTIP